MYDLARSAQSAKSDLIYRRKLKCDNFPKSHASTVSMRLRRHARRVYVSIFACIRPRVCSANGN